MALFSRTVKPYINALFYLLNNLRLIDSLLFTAMTQPAIQIFFSYAREDKDICDQLFAQLKPLERKERIEPWRDLRILSGERWNQEIQKKLQSADIILLLISSHFLNSSFCYDEEMSIALAKERQKEAIVIPIAVSDVDWQGLPFSYLNALPQNRTPIRGAENEDSLLANAARGIRKQVDAIALERMGTTLNQLNQSPALAAMRSHLRAIKTLYDNHQYPLAVYEILTQAVLKLEQDLNQGAPLYQALSNAAHGRYFSEQIMNNYGPEHISTAKRLLTGFYQKEKVQPSPHREPETQSQTLDVHVVLLAMTRQEAEELADTTAFANQPTSRFEDNFRSFQHALEDDFPDWIDNYGERAELWQPLGTSRAEVTTLDTLVSTAIERAERELTRAYANDISLVRNYQDVRELHQSHKREVLEELRRDECLIIIDAVSLYHPDIFRAFQRSLLDVYHNTFVVTYAPNEHLLSAMQDMIVALEFPVKDMGFLYRQDPDAVDGHRCIATSESFTFRRCLNSQVVQAVEDRSFRDKTRSSVREHFYNTSPS